MAIIASLGTTTAIVSTTTATITASAATVITTYCCFDCYHYRCCCYYIGCDYCYHYRYSYSYFYYYVLLLLPLTAAATATRSRRGSRSGPGLEAARLSACRQGCCSLSGHVAEAVPHASQELFPRIPPHRPLVRIVLQILNRGLQIRDACIHVCKPCPRNRLRPAARSGCCDHGASAGGLRPLFNAEVAVDAFVAEPWHGLPDLEADASSFLAPSGLCQQNG